jgi:hypothetical protein
MSDEQLTREDLRRMSAAEIVKAHAAGRCDDLLTSTAPTDATSRVRRHLRTLSHEELLELGVNGASELVAAEQAKDDDAARSREAWEAAKRELGVD